MSRFFKNKHEIPPPIILSVIKEINSLKLIF